MALLDCNHLQNAVKISREDGNVLRGNHAICREGASTRQSQSFELSIAESTDAAVVGNSSSFADIMNALVTFIECFPCHITLISYF